MAVFNDPISGKRPKIKLRYGTGDRARETIKGLRKQPYMYQLQAGYTMYYRAKYHKHQTKGMKNAKKIYKKFLNSLKRNKRNKSKKRLRG